MARAKVTNAKIKQVNSLREDGLSYIAIGKIVGLAHTTVRDILTGRAGPTLGDDGKDISKSSGGWATRRKNGNAPTPTAAKKRLLAATHIHNTNLTFDKRTYCGKKLGNLKLTDDESKVDCMHCLKKLAPMEQVI